MTTVLDADCLGGVQADVYTVAYSRAMVQWTSVGRWGDWGAWLSCVAMPTCYDRSSARLESGGRRSRRQWQQKHEQQRPRRRGVAAISSPHVQRRQPVSPSVASVTKLPGRMPFFAARPGQQSWSCPAPLAVRPFIGPGRARRVEVSAGVKATDREGDKSYGCGDL